MLNPVTVLVVFYLAAVGLAFLFSGSVAAPLTACPIGIAGGLLAGWLDCRRP